MKLLLLALATVVVARPGDDTYAKYENMNMDEVIGNMRLLKSITHCFVGDGKCTPEASDIKKLMPEAIQTSCAKCSEKQKEVVAKTINAIKEKLPAEWEILSKQNDPEGKHADELKKFLAAYLH